LAKPNFRHIKKQKELARKTRQQAKQQRRAERSTTAPANEAPNESGTVKS
jgi:hypothetical protein